MLRDADEEHWSVLFSAVDGQWSDIGDAGKYFSMQSTSKPIVYDLALAARSNEHTCTEMEPNGLPSNSEKLLQDSRPHNPMGNARAIMA